MTSRIIFIAAFYAVVFQFSQSFAQESPVEHMNVLADREEILSQKYMSYINEVAHGNRARKMEKRREDLVNSVRESIREAGKARPYKGDVSLREAYKEYWTVLLSVFNEDYHKIVDMEEVAEQSYDAMEAYLLIQEKAGQRLNEAYDKVPTAYYAFAERHGVRLVEGQKSKLSRKLDQAGLVNKYFNYVYLVYFKSTVQEGMMLKGLNTSDINAVEQARSSMEKYATEGLQRLDTMKTFKNDGSVITACRKVLEFQKSEAAKALAFTAFLSKVDEFNKIKKAYDAKPQAKRTQSDVDTYNKAVGDYNSAINEYNKVNGELNNGRTKVMDHWERTRKQFLDRHVPHK
jgi:hypothetical protein